MRSAAASSWTTQGRQFHSAFTQVTANGLGASPVPFPGPIVLGADGIHHLDDGRVDGTDPLGPFGPTAAADLRRHNTLPHAGDILVNSRLDGTTDEVAAFEELVGCHGGLGGWQTRPVLIHPADWPAEPRLAGADAVHRQLVGWLDQLGQRHSAG
jgi:hypothetical protein